MFNMKHEHRRWYSDIQRYLITMFNMNINHIINNNERFIVLLLMYNDGSIVTIAVNDFPIGNGGFLKWG